MGRLLYRKKKTSAVLQKVALHSTLYYTLCCTFAQTALAESPNSWVRGSHQHLTALLNDTQRSTCHDLVCPIPLTPITLTIRTPSMPLARVRFTSAELASPSTETTYPSQIAPVGKQQRPILLRGWIQSRIPSKQLLPIAATITRSTKIPVLSITAPSLRRGKQTMASSLSSTHVLLTELMQPSKRNARSRETSSFAATNVRCGVTPPGDYPRRPTQAAASAPSPVTARATFPTLYIATDFDQQFAKRARCSSVPACNDAIINVVHATAVLYESQLGYTLTVARQFGPTTIGNTTSPTSVLDAAQVLSLTPRSQFLHTGSQTTENQVDLFQFFTGRTMDEKTIGIAYVGTACRNDQTEFSQSVVQYVSEGLNPVIAAHEIGHTLNALHTSSGIMRPNLSNNTPKSFSSSSLLTISNHLDAWYSECRQGLAPGATTPTPTPTPRPGGGSSSSNPYSGKPVTVGLAPQSFQPKTFSLRTTVTSINPTCAVIIRAGTTSLGALRGEGLVSFTPTEITTTKTGAALFRVKPGSTSNSNVYFVAEHSCTDGTVLEVSRVQKFNPNRIRGISRSQRSKRIWLNALRESLQ